MFEKEGEIVGHAGAIYDIALSHEEVFTASADGFIAQWNLSTKLQQSFAIKCSSPPYSLVLVGKDLWFGLSSGDLHIVDTNNKVEKKYFQQHRKAIFSLVHLPQKNIVVAGDADGNLSFWQGDTYKLLLFLPLNCGKIRKINVRQDGELFAIHGQDGTIRIFETTHFNEIKTFQAHTEGACCSVFSGDTHLVSGGKDGLLKIWDWQNDQLLTTLPAHNFAIYDIQLSTDSTQIYTASRDKSIKIWDVSTYAFVQKLEQKNRGHKHSVNALKIIDNQHFISASDDKKLILWQKI